MSEETKLRRALATVVSEAWWVLSGGDDATDRCPDCGLAGVGELRAQLKAAEALLPTAGCRCPGCTRQVPTTWPSGLCGPCANEDCDHEEPAAEPPGEGE